MLERTRAELATHGGKAHAGICDLANGEAVTRYVQDAAEEIADVALFLTSSMARWVTGQAIAVDGGQLLSF
jgi:3-oxoacyl-[acyl-carrier protein] reductase